MPATQNKTPNKVKIELAVLESCQPFVFHLGYLVEE
jgi:hypothetical protein